MPGWFLLLAIICILNSELFSNPIGDNGYRVSVTITQIPDTVLYLANYYGDKTYLTDTAFLDESGRFVFEGDSLLPGGIYIIAGQSNNKYFELIVDKYQQFSVSTPVSGIPHKMSFSNTSENELFYQYVNRNIEIRKEIESWKEKKNQAGNDTTRQGEIEKQIDSLFNILKNHENEVIDDNPESFVSTVLKAKQEPALVAPRYLENGQEDSVFAYQSYKQHYWDNLDPADERLLRTPLYNKRLKNYFEKVVYQHPDTIISEADKFVKLASGNKETYKYAIWYLTYKFETSKIMGYDEIFVHMVDKYYSQGHAYWADSTIVASLMKRADELRQVLIGSQAQNMILIDSMGGFKSLYAVEANYTLIMFYEISCSHCRKEIAELKSWYPDNTFGLEIFAVCTDTSLSDWKKFLIEQKLDWIHVNGTRSVTPDYHDLYDIRVTPTLYLLDDRKKIIAKRLKADQLFPFLENYNNRKSIQE